MYDRVISRAYQSTHPCSCAVCHEKMPAQTPHLRLTHEAYSFKVCPTCLTKMEKEVSKLAKRHAKLTRKLNLITVGEMIAKVRELKAQEVDQ